MAKETVTKAKETVTKALTVSCPRQKHLQPVTTAGTREEAIAAFIDKHGVHGMNWEYDVVEGAAAPVAAEPEPETK